MTCTAKGAIIENMFDDPFVIPINIPEKFGEISMWFTWNPDDTEPFMPTAKIKTITERKSSSSGR